MPSYQGMVQETIISPAFIIPYRSFKVVSEIIGLIGVASKRDYRYILIVIFIDVCARWPEAVSLWY